MVGTGSVVACGFRRPVAEEHRTGAGDLINQFTCVAGLNNQVFWTVGVRNGHALRQIFGDNQPTGTERLAGGLSAGKLSELAFNGFGNAFGKRSVWRQ